MTKVLFQEIDLPEGVSYFLTFAFSPDKLSLEGGRFWRKPWKTQTLKETALQKS